MAGRIGRESRGEEVSDELDDCIEDVRRQRRQLKPAAISEPTFKDRITFNQIGRLMLRAMGGNIESRELPGGAHERIVKETSMQWTSEYPTRPGYYWVRNIVFAEME